MAKKNLLNLVHVFWITPVGHFRIPHFRLYLREYSRTFEFRAKLVAKIISLAIWRNLFSLSTAAGFTGLTLFSI